MNFIDAINRVLGIEGGYVNNPADPGGETNWGISKRSYPNVDIKNLTRDQAIDIYHRDFWEAAAGESMSPAVAYQVLDFSVNSGIGTAIRALQRAIGVADDGHFGAQSLAAMAAQPIDKTLALLLSERLTFMTGLKNWSDESRGWARRIATDLRYAATDI